MRRMEYHRDSTTYLDKSSGCAIGPGRWFGSWWVLRRERFGVQYEPVCRARNFFDAKAKAAEIRREYEREEA